MARGNWSQFTSLPDLARQWNPPGDPGADFDRANLARRVRTAEAAELRDATRRHDRHGRPGGTDGVLDDGELVEPGRASLARNGVASTPYGQADTLPSAVEAAQAGREVGAWNAAHPVGCEVKAPHPGGPIRSKTSSPAYLLECGTPVVDIEGFQGTWPLRIVTPLTRSDALPSAIEAAVQAERPGCKPWAQSNDLERATAVRLMDELILEMIRSRSDLQCRQDWDASRRERLRAALHAAEVVCNADVEGREQS